MIIELNNLATKSIAGGTVSVITFARVGIFHGPRAPLFIMIIGIMWFDAASENKITSRTGNREVTSPKLMTHFVVADVGSARSDADSPVVVIAVARGAVVEWIIVWPFLVICCIFCVTSKNLTDTKYCQENNINIALLVRTGGCDCLCDCHTVWSLLQHLPPNINHS